MAGRFLTRPPRIVFPMAQQRGGMSAGKRMAHARWSMACRARGRAAGSGKLLRKAGRGRRRPVVSGQASGFSRQEERGGGSLEHGARSEGLRARFGAALQLKLRRLQRAAGPGPVVSGQSSVVRRSRELRARNLEREGTAGASARRFNLNSNNFNGPQAPAPRQPDSLAPPLPRSKLI